MLKHITRPHKIQGSAHHATQSHSKVDLHRKDTKRSVKFFLPSSNTLCPSVHPGHCAAQLTCLPCTFRLHPTLPIFLALLVCLSLTCICVYIIHLLQPPHRHRGAGGYKRKPEIFFMVEKSISKQIHTDNFGLKF